MEVRAQEDLISELGSRLTQLGISVKSITIDTRLPFEISITLQSSTSGDHRTEEDAWNEFLAEREAILAHKFGLNLYSFTLILVNQEGKTLDWSKTGLDPHVYSRAYTQFNPGNKHLDNQATASLAEQQLDFKGMTVDKIKVTTGAGSDQSVQTLSIWLSTKDLQTANRAIPGIIMDTIIVELDKINQESETSLIAICRLWVADENGNNLLSYAYDVQLGRQTWGMAPGVTTDWFPHPAPTWFPSPTPTSTPPGYPPPEAEPTRGAPYPYP
jgi:hypothetical protein